MESSEDKDVDVFEDENKDTELSDSDDKEEKDNDEVKKKRNKRKPKYTKEAAMNAILRSLTETGNILRSIGYAEGAPRAGRDTVEEVWKLVDQVRPQSEIKRVMVVAAQLASGAGKKTITVSHIKNANDLVLALSKTYRK